MVQNQTSHLLQKAAPIIMRELGPRIEPLIAEKLITPLIQKVGPPIAKRIAYPLARRAGMALFNKVGFPLLNQLFEPDSASVQPNENALPGENKLSKFKIGKTKGNGKSLKNIFRSRKNKTKSLQTPAPDQAVPQAPNPLLNQTSLPNQTPIPNQQFTQISPETSVPPVNPLPNDSLGLFNENQAFLPNYNTALPWRRRQ
ncbi:MAG: hypothetical protein GX351_00770 [Peptococcaceae bacterium]|jgi:hypothetical protein|nr:hypothetical protein [Peptococcaceae bacterium]